MDDVPPLKIEYYSDLHLECEISPTDRVILSRIFKFTGDVLILAGDIFNPHSYKFDEFVKYLSERYLKVFYIAGNHEYYSHHDIDETNDLIGKYTEKYPNFIFLNNTSSILNHNNEKVLFIGSTLWSHIPEELYSSAKNYMNDFIQIKDFTPERQSHLHATAKEYLKKAIGNIPDDIDYIVIITHHAPVRELCSPKMYRNHATNCCFESDCSDVYTLAPNGVWWISGHTHYNTDFEIGDCAFISNQRGYRGNCKRFKSGKTFEL